MIHSIRQNCTRKQLSQKPYRNLETTIKGVPESFTFLPALYEAMPRALPALEAMSFTAHVRMSIQVALRMLVQGTGAPLKAVLPGFPRSCFHNASHPILVRSHFVEEHSFPVLYIVFHAVVLVVIDFIMVGVVGVWFDHEIDIHSIHQHQVPSSSVLSIFILWFG